MVLSGAGLLRIAVLPAAERVGVAALRLLVQFEPLVVDAPRGIDGQHELQIHLRLRPRRGAEFD